MGYVLITCNFILLLISAYQVDKGRSRGQS